MSWDSEAAAGDEMLSGASLRTLASSFRLKIRRPMTQKPRNGRKRKVLLPSIFGIMTAASIPPLTSAFPDADPHKDVPSEDGSSPKFSLETFMDFRDANGQPKQLTPPSASAKLPWRGTGKTPPLPDPKVHPRGGVAEPQEFPHTPPPTTTTESKAVEPTLPLITPSATAETPHARPRQAAPGVRRKIDSRPGDQDERKILTAQSAIRTLVAPSRRTAPPAPPQKRLVRLMPADPRQASVFLAAVTKAGVKHKGQQSLNEDTGCTWEFNLKEGAGKEHKVMVAWVFDGHGRSDLLRNGAKTISAEAYEIHKQKLQERIGDLLLLESDSRRRDIYKQLMVDTEKELRQRMGVSYAEVGTTATAVVALEDPATSDPALRRKKRMTLLSTNLGDSRAVAVSFRKVLAPSMSQRTLVNEATHLSVLTVEENMSQEEERRKVALRALSENFRQLPVVPSFGKRSRRSRGRRRTRVPLAVFIPKWDTTPYLPIHSRQQVEELVKARARQGIPYTAFYLSNNFIRRLEGIPRARRSPSGEQLYDVTVRRCGLQMSASLGDQRFEPLKARNPGSVQHASLAHDPATETVVVVASDGLWNHVDKLPGKMQDFALMLQTLLNLGERRSGQPNGPRADQLAHSLAVWAGQGTASDDVTVAVMRVPQYTLTPSP